ncbi:MAG: pilus assembly protein PilM [Phycisphaeraceae bacterium]|nr:pilus assembly protein PilM [Phycisphaeraceae bacterium]
MNKSRLSPIAIDFGVDTVKMLQISSGETTQVIGAAALLVPESARKDSAARYTFLGDAIKEMVRQQPFKGRRVMCSIPASQTFVNTFELHCGEKDSIDQQVNLHLQTTLEMDPSRLVIRNHRVGSVIRDGVTRQRVICIAAKRAVVMRYLEIATAAKLEVVGMHSEPDCIAKCFSQLYNRREADKTEARCFVDIGAAATKLVIICDQQILLARNIAVSGDELTYRHAKEHKIDFTDARLARVREAGNPLAANPFQVGLKAEQESGVAVAEGDPEDGLDPRTRSLVPSPDTPGEVDEVLDKLIDGIQMSLRYHDSVCAEQPVQRVILLGGEAHHQAIAEAIANQFYIPTFIGDPMARVMRTPGLEPMNIDVNQPQPGWAVPLGLSLSEANL